MRATERHAILLMGATATGKTDLAVELVKRFPLEIVSVDSALIYRGMDIGTAKPSAEVLSQAPHHLIDILDPAQSWSVWDFLQRAQKLIDQILARGNTPMLVGGTMMYFNALEKGINELPMADQAVRERLGQALGRDGLAALYRRLNRVDPATAARLHATDTQRILRALEVHEVTGKPLSLLLEQQTRGPEMEYHRIILDVPERASLHRRIEQRFHQMLELGFEQEVVELRGRGDLNPDLPSMRCVGYRQMWQYLDGNYNHSEMVNKSIAATRQLAKRQLTWLRKYHQVARFNYRNYDLKAVCQALELG